MSKVTVAGVRTQVQELLEYSNNEKKRNFVETVRSLALCEEHFT